MRSANQHQNSANARKLRQFTSRLKGVSFDRNRKKWAAFIKVDRKSISLGRFDTEEEAHAAYRAAAKRYFGEFSRTK